MKEVKHYICEVCGAEFKSKAKAQKCEKGHRKPKPVKEKEEKIEVVDTTKKLDKSLDRRFDENYENLRNAVVWQACRDYIKALRTVAKNPNNDYARYKITECERYFRSKSYASICDIDGEYMIKRCKERAMNKASFNIRRK